MLYPAELLRHIFSYYIVPAFTASVNEKGATEIGSSFHCLLNDTHANDVGQIFHIFDIYIEVVRTDLFFTIFTCYITITKHVHVYIYGCTRNSFYDDFIMNTFEECA